MLIASISLLLVAFTSATNAIAVTGSSLAARSSSVKDGCGQGQVIDTTTLHTVDGRDLKVTVQSCDTPASAYITRDSLALNKRQMPSVCNQTCLQSCHTNGKPAPDCTALINTINSLTGDTFIAPPGARTKFEVGNCEVSFDHDLQVPVEGCFSWMSPLVSTMNQCFSTQPSDIGECSQGNVAFSFNLLLAPTGTF